MIKSNPKRPRAWGSKMIPRWREPMRLPGQMLCFLLKNSINIDIGFQKEFKKKFALKTSRYSGSSSQIPTNSEGDDIL